MWQKKDLLNVSNIISLIVYYPFKCYRVAVYSYETLNIICGSLDLFVNRSPNQRQVSSLLIMCFQFLAHFWEKFLSEWNFCYGADLLLFLVEVTGSIDRNGKISHCKLSCDITSEYSKFTVSILRQNINHFAQIKKKTEVMLPKGKSVWVYEITIHCFQVLLRRKDMAFKSVV